VACGPYPILPLTAVITKIKYSMVFHVDSDVLPFRNVSK